MENKYPNSGRLNYSQKKVHPKSPDLYGSLTLERQYVKELLEATDSDDILVKLDAWQNDGQYGTYFSLKVNTWKKPDSNAAVPPPKPMPEPPADNSDVPF
jgi:hypothetical protein